MNHKYNTDYIKTDYKYFNQTSQTTFADIQSEDVTEACDDSSDDDDDN